MFKILLVDASSRLKTMTENFWRGTGHAVQLVQAHTMYAAIEIAAKSDFWYIDINADSVEYISVLPILRNSTDAQIIALTSNFNASDEITSYHGGLDMYTTWKIGFEQQTPESIIAYMSRDEKRPPVKETGVPKTLVHNDIVLSCDYHSCMIQGTKISITKTEFNILYYLMLNRGLVLTPRQIYYFAWGEDIYDETLPDMVRNHMKRLRKKLVTAVPSNEYIENVRGVGYRFIS